MRELYVDCSHGIQEETCIKALLELGACAEGAETFFTERISRMRGYSAGEAGRMAEALVNSEENKNTAAEIFKLLESVRNALGKRPEISEKELKATAVILNLLASLEVSKIWISPITEPAGGCQNLEICEIAKRTEACLRITEEQTDTSPAAMAVMASAAEKGQPDFSFTIEKTGYGNENRAGLRMFLIQRQETKQEDSVYRLESNIDDCTGEMLGYVMERLFLAGARDVCFLPVYMKKNRPAYQLQVICDREKVPEMEQIIFTETTTIGIRKMKVERTVLKREIKEAETAYGKVRVKACRTPIGERCYPEYEDVADISRKNNKPFLQIYQEILKEL